MDPYLKDMMEKFKEANQRLQELKERREQEGEKNGNPNGNK